MYCRRRLCLSIPALLPAGKFVVSNRTSFGKRRRMSMTTVYYYEFIHINMSALSAQRHVFGRLGADPDYLFMLCIGFGRAMVPRSAFLLRAGKAVELTSLWGFPARPTLAAARTTADSSEMGHKLGEWRWLRDREQDLAASSVARPAELPILQVSYDQRSGNRAQAQSIVPPPVLGKGFGPVMESQSVGMSYEIRRMFAYARYRLR